MAAEPVYVNQGDDYCTDCGLPSAVKIEDRPMCGHCFYLGMSAAQSRKLHRASEPQIESEPSFESAVRQALEEFDHLKRKMDELLVTLDK